MATKKMVVKRAKPRASKPKAVRRLGRRRGMQYLVVTSVIVATALILIGTNGLSADSIGKNMGVCQTQSNTKKITIKIVDKKNKPIPQKIWAMGVIKYYKNTRTGWDNTKIGWGKLIANKGSSLKESSLDGTYYLGKTNDSGISTIEIPICAIATTKGTKYYSGKDSVVNDANNKDGYIFNTYYFGADETYGKGTKLTISGVLNDSTLSKVKSTITIKLSTIYSGTPWVSTGGTTTVVGGTVKVVSTNPKRLTYRVVDKKTKINAHISVGVQLVGKTCGANGYTVYSSYNMSWFSDPAADGFYYENFDVVSCTNSKGKASYFLSRNVDGKQILVQKILIKDPKNKTLRTITPGFPIATTQTKALAYLFNKGKALSFTTK